MNAHLAIRRRLAAVLLLGAGIAATIPVAAAPQCDDNTVKTLPWQWVKRPDPTPSSDSRLSQSEFKASLTRLDRYTELVQQALGTQEGHIGTARKVVGWDPEFNGGPAADEVDVEVDPLVCSHGRAAPAVYRIGEVAVEVNRYWSLTSPSSVTMNGKPIMLLNYPLGELRG